MKKPLIAVTCNYDYRDTIGTVTHMGMSGQRWIYLADHYSLAVEQVRLLGGGRSVASGDDV